MIFSNRATADEWWRSISETSAINVFTFFTDARFKPISEAFRGRLFLQLQNDRGGRVLTLSLLKRLLTHVTASVYVLQIRSKAKPHIYWHDGSNGDNQFGIIHTACSRATTPQTWLTHYVGIKLQQQCLVQTNAFHTFRFGDLLEGRASTAVSTSADGASLSFFAGPDSNPESFWELA
ncbi:hypothetical protein BKA70DRAFT_1297866 [Coprinopsis sp. MPI-PUGE-AT-0042]|nr:hypothetical protein BKA70DRAFT_1297866 [Coprinopsis sp. MPI-PUGE-AT-0042]